MPKAALSSPLFSLKMTGSSPEVLDPGHPRIYQLAMGRESRGDLDGS
jgi:hypothetical protein